MHPLQWLGKRDRDFAALRRAGRAAIVMPALFAIGDKVIGNPALATFAAFGSFAMLLLVDFGGPLRERLLAQSALALVGAVFVTLGTLVSQSVWLSAVTMGLVGFAVMFAGVVSSVLAGATTSLLLAFILPVTLAGPASSIPDRLAGWAMASRRRVARRRAAVADAGARTAARRRDGGLQCARGEAARRGRLQARRRGRALGRAARSCRRRRPTPPSRRCAACSWRRHTGPTSLSTAGATTVRLVDELGWLSAIVDQAARPTPGAPVNRPRARSSSPRPACSNAAPSCSA